MPAPKGPRTGGPVSNQGGVVPPQTRTPNAGPPQPSPLGRGRPLGSKDGTQPSVAPGAAATSGTRVGDRQTPKRPDRPSPGAPGKIAPAPDPNKKPGAHSPGAGIMGKPGEEPEGLQPVGMVATAPGITQKQEFTVDRHLEAEEYDMAPTGIIHSRYMSVEKDEDGNLSMKDLTEEGQMKIDQHVREQRVKFGSFPGSDDPKAPKPPIRPGRRWFNPFTNSYGGTPIDNNEKSYLDEYE